MDMIYDKIRNIGFNDISEALEYYREKLEEIGAEIQYIHDMRTLADVLNEYEDNNYVVEKWDYYDWRETIWREFCTKVLR